MSASAVFGSEKIKIYIKADEHANLDSLPFRYGFYYPKNAVVDVSECQDWQRCPESSDGKSEKKFRVKGSLVSPDGVKVSGQLILVDNRSQHLKLVSIWPMDNPTENNLSDRLRYLREKGKLTPERTIRLYPYYRDGKANTVDDLLAAFTEVFSEENLDSDELKSEIKDEMKQTVEVQINQILDERMQNIMDQMSIKITKATEEALERYSIKTQEENSEHDQIEGTNKSSKNLIKKTSLNEKKHIQLTRNDLDPIITKIYGPPGTGKTTTLINLVMGYVDKGVSPTQIGYFAFTNFSTKVAKERIVQAFPNYDLNSDFAGFRTLHSLAYQTLPTNIEILNREQAVAFDKDFRIETVMMEEDDQSSVVYRAKHVVVDAAAVARSRLISFEKHLNNLPLGDSYRLNRWLGYPAKQCSRAIYPNDIPKIIEFNSNFEEYKKQLKVIDYTSILELAIERHSSVPDFDVVFIDEAQDLSKLQWRFVEKLFPKAKAVYIAGDDDQAICESFGADPVTFVKYPSAEEQVLTQSYRVPKRVHNGIQQDQTVDSLRQLFVRKEKTWEPNNTNEGWYGSIGLNGLHDLVLNYQKKDWLIMAATHGTLRMLSDFLAERNIPHLLSNRLVPEHKSTELPSIKLATVWGAKGGEADITALLRGEYVDEKMFTEDPRLVYVARTRTKHVHFDVFQRSQFAEPKLNLLIDGLPNCTRVRSSIQMPEKIAKGEVGLSPTLSKPMPSQTFDINTKIKDHNSATGHKERFANNAATLVSVDWVQRGRYEGVELCFDDGSRRAKIFGDLEKTYDLCRLLIGKTVITEPANPAKNNEYEWFNNIYLIDK